VVLLSVLSSFPPQWTRMLPALPAFALLSSLGLATLLRPFSANWDRRIQAGLLFGLVAVLAVAGLRDYFVEVPRQFPPTLPDIIGMEAKRPNATPEVVVLYETQRELQGRPLLLDIFRSDVRYVSLFTPRDGQQLADVLTSMPPDRLRLYFDAASAAAALQVAGARFGPGDVRFYNDAEGRVIGGSYRPAAR
jgi:hypothetical protein